MMFTMFTIDKCLNVYNGVWINYNYDDDLWVMSTPVIPFTIAGNEFMISKTSPVIWKGGQKELVPIIFICICICICICFCICDCICIWICMCPPDWLQQDRLRQRPSESSCTWTGECSPPRQRKAAPKDLEVARRVWELKMCSTLSIMSTRAASWYSFQASAFFAICSASALAFTSTAYTCRWSTRQTICEKHL